MLSTSNETEQNRHLASFLSQLGERMELVADYEAKIASFEAPRFNVFDYVEPDENKATAILADLLNPHGRHCQRGVFLESFLKLIEFDKPSKSAIAGALVRTEHLTGENRRIDLTITMDRCIVGLENKIDAGGQTNQVGHYIDFLGSLTDDWFFVFLTRKRESPDTCSPAKWNEWLTQKKVRSLSYTEISSWLHSSMTRLSSDRVRIFVQDMAKWAESLTGESVKNSPTEERVKEFLLEHPEYVKTSLAVAKASSAVRKALILNFCASLEQAIEMRMDEIFEPGEWSLTERISENSLDSDYSGISIRRHSWELGCVIGIEAKSPNFSEICFGLHWPQANAQLKRGLIAGLNDLGIGRSRGNARGWIWCPSLTYVGVNANSGDDSEVITAMHDGRRKHIIEHFVGYISRVVVVVRDLLDNHAGHQAA